MKFDKHAAAALTSTLGAQDHPYAPRRTTVMKKGDNAAALADAYLDAKHALADAELKVTKIRESILATDRARIEGARGVVTVTMQDRRTLDADAVRKLLTPRQMAACMKSTKSSIVRVKPVAGVPSDGLMARDSG
jgi:hypothetical protein